LVKASGCRFGFRLEPGGYREGGVNLGDGGPHGGGVLPVSVAEVLGCFLRELLGFAEVSSAIHRGSRCLVVCYGSDTAFGRPVNRWPAGIGIRVAACPRYGFPLVWKATSERGQK
jgi:hypothetical protein